MLNKVLSKQNLQSPFHSPWTKKSLKEILPWCSKFVTLFNLRCFRSIRSLVFLFSVPPLKEIYYVPKWIFHKTFLLTFCNIFTETWWNILINLVFTRVYYSCFHQYLSVFNWNVTEKFRYFRHTRTDSLFLIQMWNRYDLHIKEHEVNI